MEMELDIKIKGIIFNVNFKYYEGEENTDYYADGSGHQGISPSIDDISIFYNGENFTEIFEDDLDKIENLIFDKINE